MKTPSGAAYDDFSQTSLCLSLSFLTKRFLTNFHEKSEKIFEISWKFLFYFYFIFLII